MMDLSGKEVKVRKIGNSEGVILPKELISNNKSYRIYSDEDGILTLIPNRKSVFDNPNFDKKDFAIPSDDGPTIMESELND
ncbi:AbrB/MazE/SpoVT family DNA-binding domain-containing protein [Companilactobacillus sp. HBUAS59699]|uniref:AbrB/MazE/SpoVT family DNA-binding domain-containing protein n=1 Tax=Companilactobacillus sp. HBUAS59699 TaxID=3109358 RepID=UPI002FF184A5